MPPSVKNPTQELLLKVLTGVVSVLGTITVGLIAVIWSSVDTRLANIEQAFVKEQTTVARLEVRVENHDRILASMRD